MMLSRQCNGRTKVGEHQGVPVREYDLLPPGRWPSMGLSQLGLRTARARLPGDLARADRPTHARPGDADVCCRPEESSGALRPRGVSSALFQDPGATVP